MLHRSWLLAIVLPLGSAIAQDKPAVPLQPAPAAKQPTQEELVKLRDEKLALPVFKLAPWTFDYDAAREQSKKTGKPIFTYFSRSYAH